MESRLRPRRGKKAATAKKASTALTDDEQVQEKSEEELENRIGAEESACESEDESLGKQPTKKARRAKTPKAFGSTRGKTKGRGKKCLSLIFTMPMDVLYEILSLLSLKDILSLYQTNKQFNQLLASSQATFVWKGAREAEGCPDPTPDMSEPEWAFLIYGSTRCNWCRGPNCQVVDFWLRRRICVNCKKSRLMQSYDVAKSFPSLGRPIINLIPYTPIGGWDQGCPSPWGKYYVKSDVQAISKVWTELAEKVKKGEASAQAKLDEYKETRTHLLATISKRANTAFEWHSKMLRAKTRAKQDAAYNRRESIYQRFEKMGYPREDIEYAIEDTPEVEQQRELTERIWKRIHPLLEEKIKAYIRDRILRDRRVYLEPLLQQYMQELPPNTWLNYPHRTAIFLRPEFNCLFEEGDSEEIVKSKWQTEVLPRLPQVTERWLKERKKELRKLVLPDSIPPKTQIDSLGLAVAVFSCDNDCACECSGVLRHVYMSSNLPLHGWDEARFHLHHHLIIFEKAQNVVKTLLSAVNLDPLTTTADLMDNGDHLFYCVVCTSRGFRDIGMDVYNWREAVRHTIGYHGYDHLPGVKWKALPSKYHKSVVSTACQNECWSCNHCGVNTRYRETLDSVKSHLATKHRISQPKEGIDLILFPSDAQRCPRRTYEGPCQQFRT